MKPLNKKKFDKIFIKKDIFDLFEQHNLGFLISKGKLAEFYCKILLDCKWPKNKYSHYDLIKNNKKYEVKTRKRKKGDNSYSEISDYINGRKSPDGFPVPVKKRKKPYFDYLLYVHLNSNNKLLAIFQYNSNFLNYGKKIIKNKQRINFPTDKFKVKYCIDSIYKNLKKH